MLKFELIQTYKHSIKILLRQKKAPIFTSQKFYKNTLPLIMKQMNKVFLIFCFFIATTLYSQSNKKSGWLLFSQENIVTIDINKTGSFKVKNLRFDIVWDKQLSHSENIGYYGGIKTLTIYENKKLLQTINNIEDDIALGTISIKFYDYNLDGHLDFTVPIDCGKICWDKYYIFNHQTNKYENLKDWDYLRIQKINKIKKQILSEPNGTAFEDNSILYQIRGLVLDKLR